MDEVLCNFIFTFIRKAGVFKLLACSRCSLCQNLICDFIKQLLLGHPLLNEIDQLIDLNLLGLNILIKCYCNWHYFMSIRNDCLMTCWMWRTIDLVVLLRTKRWRILTVINWKDGITSKISIQDSVLKFLWFLTSSIDAVKRNSSQRGLSSDKICIKWDSRCVSSSSLRFVEFHWWERISRDWEEGSIFVCVCSWWGCNVNLLHGVWCRTWHWNTRVWLLRIAWLLRLMSRWLTWLDRLEFSSFINHIELRWKFLKFRRLSAFLTLICI